MACSDDASDGGGSGGTSGAAGSGGSAGGGSGCEGSPCDAPPEQAALLAFLQAGSYQSWNKESAAHTSTGPHATSVRTYVSPKLGKSLQDGAATDFFISPFPLQ